MSTPARLLIRLYDAAGLGLILLRPTGITYSNQTGGVACLQPESEGAYLPLVDELVEQEALLREYFTGPKWQGACCHGIDEETAQEIDRTLSLSEVTRELGLRVNRTQLEESHEAWVFVDVSAQPGGVLALVSAMPASQGILTWTNSD